MKTELPDTLAEFGAVVRDAAASVDTDDLTAAWESLYPTGAFEAAGLKAPDPDNAHLAALVVVENLAAGKIVGPLAESIWAYGPGGLDPVSGWLCAPVLPPRDDRQLIPYGADCDAVLRLDANGGLALGSLASAELADTPAHHGRHVWLQGAATPTFEEMAGPAAWRLMAAATVGYMTVVLDLAVEYGRNREQFGRPIASFQAVQFRLAEVAWRLSGLRLLVYEAGWRADRGDPRADAVSALAWVYAREMGRRASRHLHQVFGAVGFTDEFGVTRLTGAIAMLRIGTPQERAVRTVLASRARLVEPASTILGGFVAHQVVVP